MPEYSNYLEGLDDADTLTGDEILGASQDGAAVKLTVQQIADLTGGGHTIEEEGTPLTQRTSMNFTGSGVTVTDAGGKTVVTIPGIVGLQDFPVTAAAMWPTATAGCSELSRIAIATSLFNIQGLRFDQTTQEFAQFQLVFPRNWNNGTVTVIFYWTAQGSPSGTVQWGISGGAYSNGDALTTAFGTAQTVTDTFLGNDQIHITDATAAITLAGTPADGDFIGFQISRNPASDTMTGDAILLAIVLTLTTDAATV